VVIPHVEILFFLYLGRVPCIILIAANKRFIRDSPFVRERYKFYTIANVVAKMRTRLLVILLIVFSACQTGRIPCPKVKADPLRRSFAKRTGYSERNTTASAREIQPANVTKPVKPTINYSRGSEVKPALENIEVEEWDCPKPGTKRHLPKALKDNIKKNKRAYEAYYRNRADSLQALKKAELK
jgi:hypothetical protein